MCKHRQAVSTTWPRLVTCRGAHGGPPPKMAPDRLASERSRYIFESLARNMNVISVRNGGSTHRARALLGFQQTFNGYPLLASVPSDPCRDRRKSVHIARSIIAQRRKIFPSLLWHNMLTTTFRRLDTTKCVDGRSLWMNRCNGIKRRDWSEKSYARPLLQYVPRFLHYITKHFNPPKTTRPVNRNAL